MRKLLCVVVLCVIAGAAAFGEDASVIPKGSLRLSHDQNLGFTETEDGLLVTAGYGAEYATSNWLNLQLLWNEGIKFHPDLRAGSIFFGAKVYIAGEGSLTSKESSAASPLTGKIRASAALGILIPPGKSEPTLFDQDQMLWGTSLRVYGDYQFNQYFYINAFFESNLYPPQYQSDNLAEYRDWVRHYQDFTFELEAHTRIPIEKKGIILKFGAPIRYFFAPYMNASDELATSQYFVSAGTYFGFIFPNRNPPGEIYLKYNARIVGHNIRQAHLISLVGKVTIPPESLNPNPKKSSKKIKEAHTEDTELTEDTEE